MTLKKITSVVLICIMMITAVFSSITSQPVYAETEVGSRTLKETANYNASVPSVDEDLDFDYTGTGTIISEPQTFNVYVDNYELYVNNIPRTTTEDVVISIYQTNRNNYQYFNELTDEDWTLIKRTTISHDTTQNDYGTMYEVSTVANDLSGSHYKIEAKLKQPTELYAKDTYSCRFNYKNNDMCKASPVDMVVYLDKDNSSEAASTTVRIEGAETVEATEGKVVYYNSKSDMPSVVDKVRLTNLKAQEYILNTKVYDAKTNTFTGRERNTTINPVNMPNATLNERNKYDVEVEVDLGVYLDTEKGDFYIVNMLSSNGETIIAHNEDGSDTHEAFELKDIEPSIDETSVLIVNSDKHQYYGNIKVLEIDTSSQFNDLLDINDEVSLKNLSKDKTYSLDVKLYQGENVILQKEKNIVEVINSGMARYTDNDDTFDLLFNVWLGDIEPDKNITDGSSVFYSIVSTLRENGEVVSVHNEHKGDAMESFFLKYPKVEEPEPTPTPTTEFSTKVRAEYTDKNDKKISLASDDNKPLEIDIETIQNTGSLIIADEINFGDLAKNIENYDKVTRFDVESYLMHDGKIMMKQHYGQLYKEDITLTKGVNEFHITPQQLVDWPSGEYYIVTKMFNASDDELMFTHNSDNSEVSERLIIKGEYTAPHIKTNLLSSSGTKTFKSLYETITDTVNVYNLEPFETYKVTLDALTLFNNDNFNGDAIVGITEPTTIRRYYTKRDGSTQSVSFSADESGEATFDIPITINEYTYWDSNMCMITANYNLYDKDDKLLFEHIGMYDKDQILTKPKIDFTQARIEYTDETGTHSISSTRETPATVEGNTKVKLFDTVNYYGLFPGEEYLIKFIVYDDCLPYSEEKVFEKDVLFTPEIMTGTVEFELGELTKDGDYYINTRIYDKTGEHYYTDHEGRRNRVGMLESVHIGTKEFKVSKEWIDEDESIRPPFVTYQLKGYVNGELVYTSKQTTIKEDYTCYSDSCLFYPTRSTENYGAIFTVPIHDKDGNEIDYELEETHSPNYKVKEIKKTDEGFVVVNEYAPPKTTITLTKELIGESDKDEFGIYIMPITNTYSNYRLAQWKNRFFDKQSYYITVTNFIYEVINSLEKYDETSNKPSLIYPISKLLDINFIKSKIKEIKNGGVEFYDYSALSVKELNGYTDADFFTEEEKEKVEQILPYFAGRYTIDSELAGDRYIYQDNIYSAPMSSLDPDYIDYKFIDKYNWPFFYDTAELVYEFGDYNTKIEEAFWNNVVFYTTIKVGETKTIELPTNGLISLAIIEEDSEGIEEFEPIFYNKLELEDDLVGVKVGELKNNFTYTLVNKGTFIPEITNTTVKVGESIATTEKEATYKLGVKEGGIELFDTVSFEGLDKDLTYTIKSTLYSDGKEVQIKITEIKNQLGGSVEVVFNEKIQEGTYDVKTELLLDNKVVFTHNEELDTKLERATITKQLPLPLPTVVTSAESQDENGLIPEKNQTIVDTVTLTNLTVGVEYTLTGELMVKSSNTEVEQYVCKDYTFTAKEPNETHKVTFDSIDATNLGGDKLVVFETLTWKSDVHGDTKEVKHDDINDEAQTVVVKRYPTIQISKIDATTSEELPGATLIVKNANGDTVKQWISTEETYKLQLEPGEYTLTEITAPSGYEVAETINFTVDENGLVGSEKVVMKDTPKEYKVKINKTALNGKELAGATIKVTGENFEKEWISKENETMDIVVLAGVYTLEEVVAPEGFDRVITKVDFSVSKEGEVKILTTEVENGEIEYKDGVIVLKDRPSGVTLPFDEEVVISVVKKSDDDKKLPLKGAEITLFTEDGKIAKDTEDKDCIALTDENGEVKFKVFKSHYVGEEDEYGRVVIKQSENIKYYIQETKAPEGYHINSNKFEVVDGKEIEILDKVIVTPPAPQEAPKNETPKSDAPEKNAPKTGDTNNIALYIILGFTSLSGAIVLLKKSRTKTKNCN